MTAHRKINSTKSTQKGRWAMFLFLLIAVMISAIGVVYSTHQSRNLLNELQQLEIVRNQLQVEWGQLLLEQSSLVSQGRVEDIAMSELGMEVPAMENVVVLRSNGEK
ncbi:MAG: cell division protein FtsL [Pseudohongiellaceae bacterium]